MPVPMRTRTRVCDSRLTCRSIRMTTTDFGRGRGEALRPVRRSCIGVGSCGCLAGERLRCGFRFHVESSGVLHGWGLAAWADRKSANRKCFGDTAVATVAAAVCRSSGGTARNVESRLVVSTGAPQQTCDPDAGMIYCVRGYSGMRRHWASPPIAIYYTTWLPNHVLYRALGGSLSGTWSQKEL